MMMNGMMDGGLMMWGVGLIWLLVVLLLVLGVAALVKYLFFNNRRPRNGDARRSGEPRGGT